MNRRALLIVMLLTPFPARAAENSVAAGVSASPAAEADKASVFVHAWEKFKKEYSSREFYDMRLSSQNLLLLDATNKFLASSASKQAQSVSTALLIWRDALLREGITEYSPCAVVLGRSGGSGWRLDGTKARKIEGYSDFELFKANAGTKAGPRGGNWFGFFGGQATTGNGADIAGWNARLGTTLFKNQYDLAVEYNYQANKMTAPETKFVSYGVIARKLFPLSSCLGWNVGLQLLRNENTGASKFYTESGVVGISYFLPGGSMDLSLTAGDHKSYALILGYTLALSSRD